MTSGAGSGACLNPSGVQQHPPVAPVHDMDRRVDVAEDAAPAGALGPPPRVPVQARERRRFDAPAAAHLAEPIDVGAFGVLVADDQHGAHLTTPGCGFVEHGAGRRQQRWLDQHRAEHCAFRVEAVRHHAVIVGLLHELGSHSISPARPTSRAHCAESGRAVRSVRKRVHSA